MDRILILSIILIFIFAYLDAYQIQATYITQAWESYLQYIVPAFVSLWYIVLAVIAIVYYFFTKDKSEAWALFLAPVILLFSGLLDLFFYLIQGRAFEATLPWLNKIGPGIVARLLGMTDATPITLYISVFLGFLLARLVVVRLKRARW